MMDMIAKQMIYSARLGCLVETAVPGSQRY